jgi:hypothetical protein
VAEVGRQERDDRDQSRRGGGGQQAHAAASRAQEHRPEGDERPRLGRDRGPEQRSGDERAPRRRPDGEHGERGREDLLGMAEVEDVEDEGEPEHGRGDGEAGR